MAITRKLHLHVPWLLLLAACASPSTTDPVPIDAVQLGGTVGHGNWFDSWQSTTAIHTGDDGDAVRDLQVRMRHRRIDAEANPQLGSLLLSGSYAGSQGTVQWTIAAFDGSRAEGSTRMMLATDGFSVLLPDLPAELAEQFDGSDDPIAPLALALGRHLHSVVGVVVTGARDEPVIEDKQVPEEGQYKCAVEQGTCEVLCTIGGAAVDVFVGKIGATVVVKLVKKGVTVASKRQITYVARAADPDYPGSTMPVSIPIPARDASAKVGFFANLVGTAYASFQKLTTYLDYVDPSYWCKRLTCNKTGGSGGGDGDGDGDGDGGGGCPEFEYDDTGEDWDASLESSSVSEEDIDCCENPNGPFCDWADLDECDPPTDCWEECYWNSWGSCGQCEWECGYSECQQGCDWNTGNCWEDQPFDFDQCWNECYWDNWGHCGDCEWQCGGSGCWGGCDWGSGNCWEDYDYYS